MGSALLFLSSLFGLVETAFVSPCTIQWLALACSVPNLHDASQVQDVQRKVIFFFYKKINLLLHLFLFLT